MSLFLIMLLCPLMVIIWLVCTFDTQSNGIFMQKRVGQHAKVFTIFKFRTLKEPDKSMSAVGALLRKTKLDEIPQLFNIILGQMSFVGPRPDVPGFADLLEGEDRLILLVKPGITSPAAVKYRNEAALLAKQQNPEVYNREVLWNDKVKMNVEYVKHWSLWQDIKCLFQTLKLIK